MSAYDYNPEVCLQVLHGIAEEIPSGVSNAGGPTISDLHRDLLEFVRNTIISRTKQLLEWLWKKYQIPQKLKHLEELEKKADKTEAWRPRTGTVDLNPTIGKYLLLRKIALEKEIEVLRKKSAMIVPYLTKISQQSKQQLEEVHSVEKKISDLHSKIKERCTRDR